MSKSMTTTTNATDICSPEYVHLVQRYLRFAKASAENIVKLAETLYVAQRTLAPDHFDSFCAEVSLDKDGSTYRKLFEIGKKAARFEPFFDRMPSAWTTVYKLATIENDEFDRVTKSDRFSRYMTAKDVTEVLGKSVNKTSSAIAISIDLHELGEPDKCAVYREIHDICERFKLSVKLSGALKVIVDGEKGTASALNPFQMEQAA